MEIATDNQFVGMDTYADSERLGPGLARRITNMMIDADGSLVSRAGFVGQFTTPLSSPVYEPTLFQRENAAPLIIFAAEGKLWRCVAGANTYTEILDENGDSFAFPDDGRGVRLVRYGKYLYGVDGSGPLFRTDGTSGESVSGLDAPTVAPSPRLISRPLGTTGIITDWSSNPAPASFSQLLANYSFEDNTPDLDDWDADGATSHAGNSNMTPQDGSRALLLDTPGDSVEQAVTPPLLSGSATQRARVYRLRTSTHSADDAARAGMVAQVLALDGSGVAMATAQAEYNDGPPSQVDAWNLNRLIAAFGELSVEPSEILVHLESGPSNPPGLDDGYYVDFAALVPLYARLEIIATAEAGTYQARMAVSEDAAGLLPEYAATFATAGLYLRRTYGAGQDWSKVAGLAVPITLSETVVSLAGRPRFRFGFQQTGSSDITWSRVCSYTDDATAIVADLTTLSPEVRDNVEHFYIQMLDNLPRDPFWSTLFTFGQPRDIGGLSVGRAYNWRVSEYKQVGAGTVDETTFEAIDSVQSSGSPLSVQLVARGDAATVELTLPAATNPDATHFLIWQFGGVFATGESGVFLYEYIVGVVDVDADSDGEGWTWDASERLFTWWGLDSALMGRSIYQVGRDSMPEGGTALAVHNSRLWMAAGNRVYGSWLLTGSREAGLYTSFTSLPTDPNLPLKGFTADVSTQSDPEGIVSLESFGTVLLIFRQAGIYSLSGFEPANFVVQSYLRAVGIGCVASRASGLIINEVGGNEMWFLGLAGLMRFDGDTAALRSEALEGVLSQRLLDPVAYSRSALLLHDLRAWLFAPESAEDTTNTCAYVWDSRVRGDGRQGWVMLRPPVAMTGAVSVSDVGRATDLYAAGVDGQLYKLAGSLDKALPGSGGTPVSWSVETRRYGGVGLGKEAIPEEIWVRVWSGAGARVPVTVAVTGDAGTWNGTLSVAPGERNLRQRAAAWARGRSLAVAVSGESSAAVRLRSIALSMAVSTRAARR